MTSRDLLEKQIVLDAIHSEDTTVLAELLSLLTDEQVFNALSDGNQEHINAKPLAPEQIAKNLLSDKEAYNEFVEAMLVGHLKNDVKTQVYWDAWFRGAKGKDLEDADNGKVFTK
jgi:hypothetical protein